VLVLVAFALLVAVQSAERASARSEPERD
jgi:hypothetical protein